MIKTLRPYQQEAINAIRKCLKDSTNPIILEASVGSGKSLICSELLLMIEKANWRALCLTMNSTLIQQNNETHKLQGGNSGVYCSGLNEKNTTKPVIFGSPHSVALAIKNNNKISSVPFNLIIIDECHNIDCKNPSSMYMRILNHYGFMAQSNNYKYRIVGLTGTPYRGKNEPIVHDEGLFKKTAYSVSTDWLIKNDYLSPPVFQISKKESLNFNELRVNSMGRFNTNELQEVVNKSHRLTHDIMKQLIFLVENGRKGAFIFCSTINHCEEAMRSLPANQAACITAKTTHLERKKILELAKNGKIKYLVNVATLLTGIDLPLFQIAAFLRPTESLVLFVQAMGRVLRLHPDKKDALVLDFAGNIERHRDWDNPILLEAVKKTIDEDKPLVICCPECMEMNTEHARRCIGKVPKQKESVIETEKEERCKYYFEFKECENHVTPGVECGAQNDIAARICHACKCELIDPNAKLSMSRVQGNVIAVDVLEARYGISGTQRGFRINCAYKCRDETGRVGSVFEHYSPVSEKAQRIFYGQFVKKHCDEPFKWYAHLNDRAKVEEMLHLANTPLSLLIAKEQEGTKIKRKIFNSV